MSRSSSLRYGGSPDRSVVSRGSLSRSKSWLRDFPGPVLAVVSVPFVRWTSPSGHPAHRAAEPSASPLRFSPFPSLRPGPLP